MRNYKMWFTLSFFWTPLAIAWLLNPGRNGSNLPSFHQPQLVLLGLCGLMMVTYLLVNLFPGELQMLCCKSEEASWSTVIQAWFSLALGLMTLWWSVTCLLNP